MLVGSTSRHAPCAKRCCWPGSPVLRRADTSVHVDRQTCPCSHARRRVRRRTTSWGKLTSCGAGKALRPTPHGHWHLAGPPWLCPPRTRDWKQQACAPAHASGSTTRALHDSDGLWQRQWLPDGLAPPPAGLPADASDVACAWRPATAPKQMPSCACANRKRLHGSPGVDARLLKTHQQHRHAID